MRHILGLSLKYTKSRGRAPRPKALSRRTYISLVKGLAARLRDFAVKSILGTDPGVIRRFQQYVNTFALGRGRRGKEGKRGTQRKLKTAALSSTGVSKPARSTRAHDLFISEKYNKPGKLDVTERQRLDKAWHALPAEEKATYVALAKADSELVASLYKRKFSDIAKDPALSHKKINRGRNRSKLCNAMRAAATRCLQTVMAPHAHTV